MKLKRYSKAEAIEILTYLADEDPFLSLRQARDIKVDQVRELLKELAQHLETEVDPDQTDFEHEGISTQAKQILSTLSPREERLLVKSFKLNA